jgi:DNA-binding response OmpR family regulator
MSNILIIDDDGIVRDALTVFLSRAGHQVITASDGGNGVLAFKNSKPDLVILDRDLPVMTGSMVFAKIREISKVPVIILTGFDAPEDAEAYLRDGAASFLSKGDGLSNVLSEVDRVLGVEKTNGKPTAARRKIAPAPRSAVRNTGQPKALILVADDDPAILKLLGRFLESLGYEVALAEDGEIAVQMAKARNPDIALLDIFMPKKDGIEVLKELTQEQPGIGFVMITGNEDEEVARACLRMGAFDYVAKPINLVTLENTIKARLLLQKK